MNVLSNSNPPTDCHQIVWVSRSEYKPLDPLQIVIKWVRFWSFDKSSSSSPNLTIKLVFIVRIQCTWFTSATVFVRQCFPQIFEGKFPLKTIHIHCTFQYRRFVCWSQRFYEEISCASSMVIMAVPGVCQAPLISFDPSRFILRVRRVRSSVYSCACM